MDTHDILAKIENGEIPLDAVELAVKIAKKKTRFPVKTTVYVHGDDDSMYSHFRDLGFSDEEIEKWDLHNIAYEIGITLQVEADGKITFLGIEGLE